MADRAEVVIVGAGVAGAATAYHLTRAGVRDVVLLEREAAPGAHASGKNAGLIRRVTEDDRWLYHLAQEGADALASPPPDLAPGPLMRVTGSVLLASMSYGRERFWVARDS